MKKISIIDYGCANYNSIKNTLKKFDCEVSITTNLKTLKKQDIIVRALIGFKNMCPVLILFAVMMFIYWLQNYTELKIGEYLALKHICPWLDEK